MVLGSDIAHWLKAQSLKSKSQICVLVKLFYFSKLQLKLSKKQGLCFTAYFIVLQRLNKIMCAKSCAQSLAYEFSFNGRNVVIWW